MKYKCVYPDCTYETDDRSLIEFHHVYPRELNVKLKKKVTIPLCPTHHKMIFCDDATSGQHAARRPESLTVVQVTNTTTGKAVIFRDMAGNEITVTVDVTTPKPDAIFAIGWTITYGISEREVQDCPKDVEAQVDAKGYCLEGNTAYYAPGHRQVAVDLLKQYIAQYMNRTKTEYMTALEKARNDYRSLA